MARKRNVPQKKKKVSAEARLLMKEMEKQKKQTKILLVSITVVMLLIGIAVGYNILMGSEKEEMIPTVVAEEGKIKILQDRVDNGQINYFTASNPSKTKFYVHENHLGNTHVRISLCDPCAGTTFTLLDGGRIIDCDVCHTQWDSETYNGIYPTAGENRFGGCEDFPPGYIPYTMEGDYIVVLEEDFE
jgi:hypothetical protein